MNIKNTAEWADQVVQEDNPSYLDMEILREGLVAELNAISLYEKLAERSTNEEIKKVFLDIAKEEKTHAGEFHQMLKKIDPQYVEELEAGKQEVEGD